MSPREKQAAAKQTFVFPGSLTKVPPGVAGSRARSAGVVSKKRKDQVLGIPGLFYVYKGGIKCLCERGRTLSVFSCLRCLLYIWYIVKTIVMCVKNIANRTSFDKMNLGPTKNMSKQPFLKKNEQIIEGEHVSGRQF